MKKIFLLPTFLLLILTTNVSAQNIKDYGLEKKNATFYLGIGSGINNNCGAAGFKLGIRLNEKMILDAGVGVGSWGSKVSLGIVFNAIDKNAWCPVLSISRASGLNDANVKLII